jgi:hypothetical protein
LVASLEAPQLPETPEEVRDPEQDRHLKGDELGRVLHSPLSFVLGTLGLALLVKLNHDATRQSRVEYPHEASPPSVANDLHEVAVDLAKFSRLETADRHSFAPLV